MKAISYSFCDWVIERIKSNLDGQLSAELILDERKGDLAQSISKAVNSGLAACVVVGVGNISPQGSRADDTLCEVEVNVAVLHNAKMKPGFDSRLFTEHLYSKFAGAEYEIPPCTAVNVRAGRLSTEGNDKKMHMFTVSYFKMLKGA